MKTLYLLSYNNYYNRELKQEQSLTDYQQYLVKYNGSATDANGNSAVIQGVNFIEGNSVDTTQVVNWGGDEPNYLLVVEDGDIVSRWFVIDAVRTRQGQLQLTLHRDVLVDFYDAAVSSDVFIEKATLTDNNDLIFNSEDMTFNQIKQYEKLLKDESNCPWVVIYAMKKDSNGVIEYSGTFNEETSSIAVAKEFTSDDPFVQACLNGTRVYGTRDLESRRVRVKGFGNFTSSADQHIVYDITPWEASHSIYSGFGTSSTAINQRGPSLGADISFSIKGGMKLFNAEWVRTKISTKWPDISNFIDGYIPTNKTLYDEIMTYNNQIIKVDNTYYRVRAKTFTETVAKSVPLDNALTTNLDSTLNTAAQAAGDNVSNRNFWGSSRSPIGDTTRYEVAVNTSYTIGSLEIVTIDSYKYSIGVDRIHNNNAPYDIFCLPFSDDLKIKNSAITGFTEVTASKVMALSFASEIGQQYSSSGGSGWVLDIQLLPYCPVRIGTITNNTFDLMDSSGKYYSQITVVHEGNESVAGYVLHADTDSFDFNVPLETPIVVNNYKIDSQCDMYRLCSPNYNGVFEFNAAKNGGISSFNVVCTYKPYIPYIKLYPEFGRLYGTSKPLYGDSRGLICGGDFSLPRATDAFATYERENKNYLTSFDRSIQNMDFNNKRAVEQEEWQRIAGTIGAAGTGLASGSLLGGTIGGGVGGLIGGAIGAIGAGVASGLAGEADKRINAELRQEARQYAIDRFGYSLGNVKALSQSLAKTTSFSLDNKYFPFLEYYTCTEVEKEALAKKIAFNGMTVMTIGKLLDYMGNEWSYKDIKSRGFIKGQLIRLERIDLDYHITGAIANEIEKGVFI